MWVIMELRHLMMHSTDNKVGDDRAKALADGWDRSFDHCISACTLYILIFFNVQPLIGNL
jgi:hypothetical protein